MATTQITAVPDRNGDQRRYHVWDGMRVTMMTWRQMSNQQRVLQLEAEQRQRYDALFNPCGLP